MNPLLFVAAAFIALAYFGRNQKGRATGIGVLPPAPPPHRPTLVTTRKGPLSAADKAIALANAKHFWNRMANDVGAGSHGRPLLPQWVGLARPWQEEIERSAQRDIQETKHGEIVPSLESAEFSDIIKQVMDEREGARLRELYGR